MSRAYGRSGAFTRRQLLALSASLGAGALPGCGLIRHPAKPICPASPEFSYLGGPLTIDAHCHVFNGTDLQVEKFLSMVAVRQKGLLGAAVHLIGAILQKLSWDSGPNGADELKVLADVAKVLQGCTSADASQKLADLGQVAYTNGRNQLQDAMARTPEVQPALALLRANRTMESVQPEMQEHLAAVTIIDRLPEHYADYQREQSAQLGELSFSSLSVRGMIAFVLQNFQYRYVTVYDYLRTYDQPGRRVVDLMLPSMVDYDWWLNKGRQPPTHLSQQVLVMEQISILTGGRVHAFAAYDPLRQVAAGQHLTTQDSLSVVQEAITKHGCVGVKLYPPMGFAAYGNEAVQNAKGAHFWARDWLPEWMDRPDMGKLLDDAMKELLLWCEANEVPVMAHTNISNGVADDFEALAVSEYWGRALAIAPRLRVNFGHFGDTSLVADGQTGLDRARGFASLMTSADGGKPGAHAFADAGYFVEVTASEPALLGDLRTLYDETAAKGNAALANRFLYGTDWEMTLTEGKINSYLSSFVKLFGEIEAGPAIQAQGLRGLSDRFFGVNAVDFVGLRKGGMARKRVDAFYSANAMPVPDWRVKVDNLAS